MSRLGVNKKQIFVMHMIECIMFTIIQSIIGCIMGVLSYYAIYRYQKDKIGLNVYNGFTKDEFVLKYTYNPYLIAIIFRL